MLSEFYKNKKVLVTGNTGFKGSWLCRILKILGSDIYGYSLHPPTNPNMFEILKTNEYVETIIGDIANFETLSSTYEEIKPDIVFHLAAQPLVREGYREPRKTYLSNVMGTVNIMECVRLYGAKSVLNVTTDKVYDNIEDFSHEYNENEKLDGFDPYSNSKSCSELITHSYVRSFLVNKCPVSTARAGNVIGGGDFAAERIIPDCVRAAISNQEVILRNPNSIRPYQHVLEPLYSYLLLTMKQYYDTRYAGSYNIGPNKDDCISTGELANLFCKTWGNGMKWRSIDENGPHEANYLKLDNSKIKNILGISPIWHTQDAISKTVEWTKIWYANENIENCTDEQIREYMKGRGIDV